MLRPGDEGYDEERTGFNLAARHAPDVVVCALGADDVRAAVGYAAARGLAVAVQGTGHGISVAAEGGGAGLHAAHDGRAGGSGGAHGTGGRGRPVGGT
ncbi:hypothetical protein GCM10020220_109110 [Nonomuraea rubra]|uniref:hypothetical protein n=1 Tax=Nonomuraea rubra TaxID=46180 RepID=UPI0031EC616F